MPNTVMTLTFKYPCYIGGNH